MDLRDIEVFVQVVEDGDFSAAARTLALTPSTVRVCEFLPVAVTAAI